MIKNVPKFTIPVRRSLLNLKVSSIGVGTARYNSLLPHTSNFGNGILLASGPTLKYYDQSLLSLLKEQQISNSQIFQIQPVEGSSYIAVICFDGVTKLLSSDTLKQAASFQCIGKEIRHISARQGIIALCCQLQAQCDSNFLQVHSLQDLLHGVQRPWRQFGNYYFPQVINGRIYCAQFHDPNPKRAHRSTTATQEKLPVTHRIVEITPTSVKPIVELQEKGQIICAAHNNGVIYYLHSQRKVSVFVPENGLCISTSVDMKSTLLCFEAFQKGVLCPSNDSQPLYMYYDSATKSIVSTVLVNIPIKGAKAALAVKANPWGGFTAYGESGLCSTDKDGKLSEISLFSITNCGLALSKDGNRIAVGDFSGTVYFFDAASRALLASTFVGASIRALAWSQDTDTIYIGCLGGLFSCWNLETNTTNVLREVQTNINILRCQPGQVLLGTSQGEIIVYSTVDHSLKKSHIAHRPVLYEDPVQREMFGSMKHYAEIWSLATSPDGKHVVSASQDQTERVFQTTAEGLDHVATLTGHTLAVTSLDWKVMKAPLGEIYVSCSDDKVIRVRDPINNFAILFEIETTLIKEWHTLTYLSLEPNGYRLAVGSQNGFLFIFDLLTKDLLYADKIHLGGIEGLEWKNGNLVTCSSDLCVQIIHLPPIQ